MSTTAVGAKSTLHFVEEVTRGTTPATPTWTPCPMTGVSIGLTKDALESAKLRADRQVEDLRHGNRNVAGAIDSELEYAAFDDLLEAAFMGTWTTNVLKTGTARRSFTFEKFIDVATDEYHRFTGCDVNTLNINVAPNQMVTMSFGIIGEDVTTNTSQVAGSIYSADVGNQPFDSFTGTITEGAASIAVVTSMDLTLDNGMNPQFVIGSSTTICPTEGKSRLTGSIEVLYESKTLYDKFINETSSELVLTLTDPAGNSYQIDIPNIKYTSGNPDVSGDGPITVSLEFTALYSSSDASQIVLTRTDA